MLLYHSPFYIYCSVLNQKTCEKAPNFRSQECQLWRDPAILPTAPLRMGSMNFVANCVAPEDETRFTHRKRPLAPVIFARTLAFGEGAVAEQLDEW